MCENCGIHLKRDPEELVEFINKHRCPSCNCSLVDDDISKKTERFAHAVITALIMSSKDIISLKHSLNWACRDYNREILVNSYGQEYSVKELSDIVNKLDSNSYSKIEAPFLEKPLRQKFRGMEEESEKDIEQDDDLDIFATAKDEISSKINYSSDNKDENQEVKPTKKVVKDYIGLCDVIFLGTAHSAPMLGKLVEQMESHNVGLVLLESGVNNNSVDADDGPVGHRAASRYKSLHGSTKLELLRGTPDDFDNIVKNGSVTGVTNGWLNDDHDDFKDSRRRQRLLDREYYNAIIEERDGKFATEIAGYILEEHTEGSLNGNVCVIAGKTHIPGIYRRLTGLSL